MPELSSQKLPNFVRYTQRSHNGIQPVDLTNHVIGYVVCGHKNVYYGDARHRIDTGQIFYFGSGCHYIENIPGEAGPFEQIIFYYTSERLAHILVNLNVVYGLEIAEDVSYNNGSKEAHETYPAWKGLQTFFRNAIQYLRETGSGGDPTSENIRMTELICLILTQPGCYLKSRVLTMGDSGDGVIEKIVRSNVFRNASIEQLAGMCNRSVTSFKKEFRRMFHESPHRWFVRQRLMHARMQLISTSKSVSEIGAESMLPNTSHFIRLFRNEYGTTPHQYRHHHRGYNVQSVKVKRRVRNLAAV